MAVPHSKKNQKVHSLSIVCGNTGTHSEINIENFNSLENIILQVKLA